MINVSDLQNCPLTIEILEKVNKNQLNKIAHLLTFYNNEEMGLGAIVVSSTNMPLSTIGDLKQFLYDNTKELIQFESL